MKRFSLDKKAPGMFEATHGGYVKWTDHEAAVAEAWAAGHAAAMRERETDAWTVVRQPVNCTAPGVDIDAVNRRPA